MTAVYHHIVPFDLLRPSHSACRAGFPYFIRVVPAWPRHMENDPDFGLDSAFLGLHNTKLNQPFIACS